ncbi:CDP-archaeol synthase [Methylomicrobium sp. Wu6]|uniref:CDP-archaeol synthase n=1 Tax=Methylomicrobium sp. Wu6 TaxID=3107928 RepID=UPI002DD68578|nr:CDP-archaeol synthase [Methylomicrobium sp. Wu6]MEC4748362.1 CDP-archaeol synthase [Methylomicrobium sp. Wu6]
MSITAFIKGLTLLLTANGAPVLAGVFADARTAKPIDGGFRLSDGRPLFGAAKTWRGLFAALVATSFVAYLLNYGLLTGILFAVGAMAGDLLSSFCKRRLGRAEGSHLRGFDTAPESLLPLLMVKSRLGVGWLEIAILVGVFYVIEEWLSPVLYKWRLRKQP